MLSETSGAVSPPATWVLVKPGAKLEVGRRELVHPAEGFAPVACLFLCANLVTSSALSSKDFGL